MGLQPQGPHVPGERPGDWKGTKSRATLGPRKSAGLKDCRRRQVFGPMLVWVVTRGVPYGPMDAGLWDPAA